jgi:putative hydrolase of the HAD superfamily
MPRLTRIFNSAETGYEKPHPHAFQMVLDAFPDATVLWMIGDNIEADVAGAQALGIPAILVGERDQVTRYVCSRISEVPAIVSRAPQ